MGVQLTLGTGENLRVMVATCAECHPTARGSGELMPIPVNISVRRVTFDSTRRKDSVAVVPWGNAITWGNTDGVAGHKLPAWPSVRAYQQTESECLPGEDRRTGDQISTNADRWALGEVKASSHSGYCAALRILRALQQSRLEAGGIDARLSASRAKRSARHAARSGCLEHQASHNPSAVIFPSDRALSWRIVSGPGKYWPLSIRAMLGCEIPRISAALSWLRVFAARQALISMRAEYTSK